jgi:DNA-binding CsgD family transcriptional regulator
MPKNRIPTYKASRILELYALYNLNKSQIAKSLNISRGTVRTYLYRYSFTK